LQGIDHGAYLSGRASSLPARPRRRFVTHYFASAARSAFAV
jgi:hypothetical protein